MADIKISVKGFNEIILTRDYNSLSTFFNNTDNVGFNEVGNDFYTYCLTSPCGGVWSGDKIKILTLPNKGRLYYNSNAGGTPSYLDVTVGQEILVRDLIDYKILRFSAEGSTDGQFTDNYITNFTFERYCSGTATNITVSVKLNMIDTKVLTSKLTVINRVADLELGTLAFKVKIENLEYSGTVLALARKLDNIKNAGVTLTPSTITLNLPNGLGNNIDVTGTESMTLPIGEHDGLITIGAVRTNISLHAEAEAILYFRDMDGNQLDYAQAVYEEEGEPA